MIKLYLFFARELPRARASLHIWVLLYPWILWLTKESKMDTSHPSPHHWLGWLLPQLMLSGGSACVITVLLSLVLWDQDSVWCWLSSGLDRVLPHKVCHRLCACVPDQCISVFLYWLSQTYALGSSKMFLFDFLSVHFTLTLSTNLWYMYHTCIFEALIFISSIFHVVLSGHP